MRMAGLQDESGEQTVTSIVVSIRKWEASVDRSAKNILNGYVLPGFRFSDDEFSITVPDSWLWTPPRSSTSWLLMKTL